MASPSFLSVSVPGRVAPALQFDCGGQRRHFKSHGAHNDVAVKLYEALVTEDYPAALEHLKEFVLTKTQPPPDLAAFVINSLVASGKSMDDAGVSNETQIAADLCWKLFLSFDPAFPFLDMIKDEAKCLLLTFYLEKRDHVKSSSLAEAFLHPEAEKPSPDLWALIIRVLCNSTSLRRAEAALEVALEQMRQTKRRTPYQIALPYLEALIHRAPRHSPKQSLTYLSRIIHSQEKMAPLENLLDLQGELAEYSLQHHYLDAATAFLSPIESNWDSAGSKQLASLCVLYGYKGQWPKAEKLLDYYGGRWEDGSCLFRYLQCCIDMGYVEGVVKVGLITFNFSLSIGYIHYRRLASSIPMAQQSLRPSRHLWFGF